MYNSSIKIATRQSKLALWQANWVSAQLKNLYPNIRIELVPLTTKGDKITDRSLAKIGGKGLFVKELEQALLNNQADLAVHSLKDMPAIQPKDLSLVVYCKRNEYRDVFISHKYKNINHLPQKAVIGTSSLRRMAQIKILRNDLNIKPLRGNVNSRIDKLFSENSDYDGIILSGAGIERLELDDLINEYLNTKHFLPAPGQGTIVIQTRTNDILTKNLIQPLNCQNSMIASKAERAFNAYIGGSCQLPIAALAVLNNKDLKICGQIAMPNGSQQITASIDGLAKDYIDLGEVLAQKILNNGGKEILAALSNDRINY